MANAISQETKDRMVFAVVSLHYIRDQVEVRR